MFDGCGGRIDSESDLGSGTSSEFNNTSFIRRFLLTYERELDRTRLLSPVDELLQTSQSAEAVRREYRGNNFENSLYFTLSLMTATGELRGAALDVGNTMKMAREGTRIRNGCNLIVFLNPSSSDIRMRTPRGDS